jgi:hypothetical protein
MTPFQKSRLVKMSTLLSPAVLFALVIFTARSLPAQQVDFSKEVLPVLKSNCFKCHGEKKAKAKLRLHTLADALKGGKNGGAIAPGKSAESLLIKRISLGKDDDDIMPPEGGPLEPSQIEALKRWIDQGAKWAEGAAPAGTEAKPAKKVNVAELPAAVTDAITKAGGRAMRLAQDTNLVTVSFRAVAGKTGDEQLASLKGAAAVAELNLAGSKITDAGLASLSGLVNLGRLHLELTGIDGSGLTHLGKLQNLHYLNLYGTKVTDDGIKSLASLKGLKKLYLWQTEVTDAGVEELEKALPGVDVNRGLVAAQVVAVEPSAASPAKKPAPKPKPPEKAVVVIAQSTDGWSFAPASEIKGEDWLKAAFDDGKWAKGKAPLGYGEADVAKKKGKTLELRGQAILFRRKFSVEKKLIDAKKKFKLLVASDDSAVVWINGKQVDKEEANHEAKYWNRTVEIAAGLIKKDGNIVSVLINNAEGSSDVYFDLQLETATP